MQVRIIVTMAVALTLGFGLPTATGAATISAAGSVQGEPNWDTAGYGDAGFAFFNTDNNDNDGNAFTGREVFNVDGIRTGTIGVDKLTSRGNTGGARDEELEDPAGGTFSPGTWHEGSIDHDNLVNVASLTFQSGAPSKVTIGVLVGAAFVQNSGDIADFPDDVAVGGVAQEVDQPADSDPEVVRADWYFFDVTGIDTAGNEQINVAASRIGDINNHKFNPVNGVAISVIPEPASLSLLAPAGLLALRRRR